MDITPDTPLQYTVTLKFSKGGAYAASGVWEWPESGLYILFYTDLTTLLDAVWEDQGAWPEDRAELSLYFDDRLARTLDVAFTPMIETEREIEPIF